LVVTSVSLVAQTLFDSPHDTDYTNDSYDEQQAHNADYLARFNQPNSARRPVAKTHAGEAFIIPQARLSANPYGFRSFQTQSTADQRVIDTSSLHHDDGGGSDADDDDEFAIGKVAKKMKLQADIPMTWIPPPGIHRETHRIVWCTCIDGDVWFD
jgi:hypothetical protein